MARLPSIDEREHPELAGVVAEINALRPGRERLSPLYRVLLNSPSFTQAWLHFLTAVRMQMSIPALYRELVLVRVAMLNGAQYEYREHAPLALAAGFSREQIDALADWSSSNVFDESQRAVLAYIDAMTREISVPDDIFAGVREIFTDRQLVELTGMIATFNFVSRFLVALEIEHDH
ncbi:MAG TPA: carboxymuconolactone decarboxylase family protein [Burkholderiales bacterium]|nr:carboxymuconolactone decarboxylase family protein [Burkholderiales bacterium]